MGDIPLLGQDTVDALVDAHLANGNDLTLASRIVDEAYTRVERDPAGRVTALIETREAGLAIESGERDIGLFIFRARPLFALLAQKLDGAIGRHTGDHGFLYIVRHLVAHNYKVEACPIATLEDLVSLNRLSDLHGV